MIHIKYDKNNPIAFNDGNIIAIANKIVKEHGSTDEFHYIEVGQDLFITAIRSAMCQTNVDHRNLVVDIVLDENNIQHITLTDKYRLSDYTNIPDLISDLLMPLL